MPAKTGKNVYAGRLGHVLSWLGCQVWNDGGVVLPPSHGIWRILSDAMEGDMQPKYIYQVVKENRWNVAAEHRASMYLDIPPESSASSLSSEEDRESSGGEAAEDEDDGQRVVYPRRTFKVIIPPSEWKNLAPQEKVYKRSDRPSGKRDVLVLPKLQWTNVISRLIWQQHELPCAYAFKSGGRVAKTPDLAQNYVTMQAKCTDCGAGLEGRILQEPLPDESVTLLVETEDTRKDRQHTKKRRCAGTERQRVSREMGDQSSAVYRRHEASSLMSRPGKIQPPLLYNPEVYRKVKQEAREGALNLSKSRDVMERIKIMKHDPNLHLGSIHDIGDDPVKVIYVTPGQLLLNNTLKKQGWYVVQLDATGPYCRRLTLVHGLSGQILLYEFVASTEKGTAQLSQMVTEKHDTVTIGHWIEDWQRRGALPPDEVVCDGSPALLSALSRKFAECRSTSVYREKCFKFLRQEDAELPSCFVRLDFIHFIGNVSKWKLWKTVSNTVLKDHYLRFTGLLVLTESLMEFRTKLLNIVTVALAATSGQINGVNVPAEEALRCLIDEVSGDSESEKLFSESALDVADSELDDSTQEDEEPSTIKKWLQDLNEEASGRSATKGPAINAYYNPQFAKKILEESASFIHWSAVMVKPFGSPNKVAHTAAMEGDFCDLKKRVLRNESKPMKLDVFINHHLKSINGQNLILSSNDWQPEQPRKEQCRENDIKSGFAQSSESSEASTDEGLGSVPDENWKNSNRFRSCSPAIVMRETRSGRQKGKDVHEGEVCEIDQGNKPGAQGNRNAEEVTEPASEQMQLPIAQRSEQEKKIEKTSAGKKMKPGYLDKNPNIETSTVDMKGTLKQPKNLILQNGNLTGFFKLSGGMCYVKNTCSFDTFIQILASAYIDFKSFRSAVDAKKKDVPTLQVVALFAMKGACKLVYQKRAEVLIPVSHLEQSREVCSTTRKAKTRRSINILEYTLAKLGGEGETVEESRLPNGNVAALFQALFPQFPSRITTWECDAGHVNEVTEVLVSPNYEHLLRSGIQGLQDSLEFGMAPERMKCKECPLIALGTVSCLDSLFIDLDSLRKDGDFSVNATLGDVPCNLSLRNKNFSLVGIVSSLDNHYSAFVRRRTGHWEKMDDCNKKIGRTATSEPVVPHLVVYVLSVVSTNQ